MHAFEISGWLPSRVSSLAGAMFLPAAVMMIGTIIGEIRMAVSSLRNGMCGRVSPSAASVPREVAIRVEKIPMMKEFFIEWTHWALVQESAMKAQPKS